MLASWDLDRVKYRHWSLSTKDLEMLFVQFQQFAKLNQFKLSQPVLSTFSLLNQFLVRLYESLSQFKQQFLVVVQQLLQTSPEVMFAKEVILEVFLLKCCSEKRQELFFLYLQELFLRFEEEAINKTVILQYFLKVMGEEFIFI